MYLDVKINNVPVQLEVKTVGPASLDDIDEFREKLISGELILIDQSTINYVEEENENQNFIENNKENVINSETNENTEIQTTTNSNNSNKINEQEKPAEQNTMETTGNIDQEKPSIIEIIEDVAESSPEIVNNIQEIFENNKDGEKPWYKSKTIISNIIAALGCIIGTLSSENPEISMYLPASILAIINLYLRSISRNSIRIPLSDKIKKINKK